MTEYRSSTSTPGHNMAEARNLSIFVSGGPMESGKVKVGNAWRPLDRRRPVSQALRAYVALATSAAYGAVREVSKISG
jgi:dihydroxyacid dehydratase/phosphogluconate dehydratase